MLRLLSGLSERYQPIEYVIGESDKFSMEKCRRFEEERAKQSPRQVSSVTMVITILCLRSQRTRCYSTVSIILFGHVRWVSHGSAPSFLLWRLA